MKTTLLLFGVIFGYITPAYSQLNSHRETDGTRGQFQIKKNDDFGNYKFDKFGNYKVDRFTDFLSNRERDGFNMLPTRPAPSSSPTQYIKQNNMPCFHPKSGDNMPCFKPIETFPMRIFNPEDVIWGTLW
ncbi:MAG TPA: hypothetical protein VK666_04280 [Chryseolinea sp.]|nr:hypothetical protein [Chryseolinea sp.]